MHFTVAVTVTFFLLAFILDHRRGVARFNQQWPPIADDEFVRLCGPNTNREIALRVRKIIADWSGMPYERIHPEQDFVRDLG